MRWVRTGRQFSMTEVGERHLEHVRAMLVEAESAQEAIDLVRAEPQGTIRVTCPVGLLGFHAADMLAQFMARCPRVNIHLEATNRRVDVIGEGVDIALRVRPLPLEDSDLALRTLSDRGQRLVASSALVKQFGSPPVSRRAAWLAQSESCGAPRTTCLEIAPRQS